MQKSLHLLIAGLVFLVSACNLFSPVDPLPPQVSEVSVVQVVSSGATISGTVSDPDGKNSRQDKKSGKITEFGFVYATQDKPTLEDGTTLKLGNATNASPFQFQGQITGLSTQTTYYVRSYAKNEGGGVSYSAAASFKTSNYTLPALSAGPVSNVTKSSADISVQFSSTGNATVNSFGICFSDKNAVPTTLDSKVTLSGTIAIGRAYPATLTGLSGGTTYYARGFAITSGGVAYSTNVVTFTLGEPTAFTDKKSFTMYYSNPYDLDLGALVSQLGSEDMTWYPYNDKAGIYPKNGAKFAVLGKVNFDNVKYSDIAQAVLTTDFINGSYSDANANKLPNGTVIAYVTNQGRFGKMYIDAHGQDRTTTTSTGGDMQVTILTYNK